MDKFNTSDTQRRGRRACMVCSVVLHKSVRSPTSTSCFVSSPPPPTGLLPSLAADLCPLQDFKREGCPNCEDYLHLAGNEEAIELCTSSVYEGLIAMADPGRSWVAKWQRIDKYRPGTYATKVMGTLPPDVISNLAEEYNIRYIP